MGRRLGWPWAGSGRRKVWPDGVASGAELLTAGACRDWAFNFNLVGLGPGDPGWRRASSPTATWASGRAPPRPLHESGARVVAVNPRGRLTACCRALCRPGPSARRHRGRRRSCGLTLRAGPGCPVVPGPYHPSPHTPGLGLGSAGGTVIHNFPLFPPTRYAATRHIRPGVAEAGPGPARPLIEVGNSPLVTGTHRPWVRLRNPVRWGRLTTDDWARRALR